MESAAEAEDAASLLAGPEQLAQLTIPDLKALLGAAKRKVGGLQQALIERCVDNGLSV